MLSCGFLPVVLAKLSLQVVKVATFLRCFSKGLSHSGASSNACQANICESFAKPKLAGVSYSCEPIFSPSLLSAYLNG